MANPASSDPNERRDPGQPVASASSAAPAAPAAPAVPGDGQAVPAGGPSWSWDIDFDALLDAMNGPAPWRRAPAAHLGPAPEHAGGHERTDDAAADPATSDTGTQDSGAPDTELADTEELDPDECDPEAQEAEYQEARAAGRTREVPLEYVAGRVAESLPTGPGLAGWLAVSRAGELEDGALAGIAASFRRLASWAAAGELAAVAQIASRSARVDRRATVDTEGRPDRVTSDATAQVALALALSRDGAQSWADLGVVLSWRLAATGAALAAGQIDLARARMIVRMTSGLSEKDARKVEAAVLAGAGWLTLGQLHSALRRAVIKADPDGAERRREQAERNATVAFYPEDEGTATLAGYSLPGVEAAAAMARITALAKAMKAGGDASQIDLIRAHVFLGLLLGTLPPAPPCTPAESGPPCDDPHAPGGGNHPGDQPWADEPLDDPWDEALPCDVLRDNPPDDEPPGDGPCDAPDDGPRDGDPPLPDQPWDDEPWDEEPPADLPSAGEPLVQDQAVEAERADQLPNGQSGVVPPSWPWELPRPSWPQVLPDLPRWQSPTRGLAGLLNLAVPLATLTGKNAEPGQLSWLGVLTPAQARQLADLAAACRATRWRVVITDQAGLATAVTHVPRARSPGAADDGAELPGLIGRVTLIARPADLHQDLGSAGEPRGSPLALTLARARAAAERTAAAADERDQRGEAVGGCAHQAATDAYRPPPRIAEFVNARDRTCRFPPCRRPAEHCDLDHTVPFDKGGLTCTCNLGSQCRTHHQLKQDPRWTLTQPAPGTFSWTTPAGRTYLSRPDPYLP